MYKRIFQSSMRLSEVQWRNATLTLAGYFVFAAVLNLIVGYNVSLDTWVKFKVFGTMLLSSTFMFTHALWLNGRQMPELPELAEELHQLTLGES